MVGDHHLAAHLLAHNCHILLAGGLHNGDIRLDLPQDSAFFGAGDGITPKENFNTLCCGINDGGDIDIRLKKADGRVCFTIRNSGAGIPAEEMPQIFERFYKSDRSARSSARRVGESAFLLLAFLCAYYGKEKRLKSLGIKG